MKYDEPLQLLQELKHLQYIGMQLHIVKYQFEMSLKKYILVYSYRQKQGKKKNTSNLVLLSYSHGH